jgi:UPF0755 protein
MHLVILLDLEGQIQLFCFNPIRNLFYIFLLLLFIIIFYFIYFFYYKNINIENNRIEILKNSNLNQVSKQILNKHSNIEKILYNASLKIGYLFKLNIKYGEFNFKENINLIDITKIISKPSNVYYELKFIDGWNKYQIDRLIYKNFKKNINFEYNEILADTYNYNKTENLDKIIKNIKKYKDFFFETNQDNELLKKYSINQIMTIASLVEKEGFDDSDKKMISSVIFNRLNKKMKLQIDASTIYAITKGKYEFNRKLTLKDLKIEDKYNTYFIKGLPPKPICLISRKTIELVLENYKSNYLFYFYDKNLKKHVYSLDYKNHKNKLLTYRKKNNE